MSARVTVHLCMYERKNCLAETKVENLVDK